MKTKIITLIGFGKIAIGLLHPVISSHMKSEVVFICCVRASKQWMSRRNIHPTIKTCLMSDKGVEKTCTKWQFNKSNETFSEFAERCKASKNPGLWIIEDDQMLIDAISNSTVIGTSIGIEPLDDFFNIVDRLNIKDVAFYAFENQPHMVKNLADKHKSIKVIHCPIDRVVVSRVFDDQNGLVNVTLGKDPSESIMIYDKNGSWENILQLVSDSSLTITSDSNLLNITLKKKLYAKNNVHKVACQLAIRDKSPISVRDKALCEVLTSQEKKYMMDLKPSLIFPAVISILSEWSSPPSEVHKDIYNDLSIYYDSALNTVSTDPNDQIGRIIHLDSQISAEHDRERLLQSLEELQEIMKHSDKNKISILGKEVGIENTYYIIKKLSEIYYIISQIKWEN